MRVRERKFSSLHWWRSINIAQGESCWTPRATRNHSRAEELRPLLYFCPHVYNVLSTRVASFLAFRCIINDRLATLKAHTSSKTLGHSCALHLPNSSSTFAPFTLIPFSPTSHTYIYFSLLSTSNPKHFTTIFVNKTTITSLSLPYFV